MKKGIFGLVLLFCVGCLSGCSQERWVYGVVTEVQKNDEMEVESFVIQTQPGEEIGVLITDETSMVCWVDDVDVDDFRKDIPIGTGVIFDHEGVGRTLITESGETIQAYNAEHISWEEIVTGETVTLSDGTPVRLVEEMLRTHYRLEDGTTLLQVQDMGPEGMSVDGEMDFDSLNETAQGNIQAYYDAQDPGYDLEEALERSYTAYQIEQAEFQTHHVWWEITPIGANEQVIYFLSSVNQSLAHSGYYEEIRTCTAFQRETGDVVEPWSLFSCPKEQAKETLLDLAAMKDPALQQEMEEALQPEYLLFYSDQLEISFPRGTLASQDTHYVIGLDYDQLSQILHDWAIPE